MDNNLLAMRLAMGAIIVCTVGLIVQLAVKITDWHYSKFYLLLLISLVISKIKKL